MEICKAPNNDKRCTKKAIDGNHCEYHSKKVKSLLDKIPLVRGIEILSVKRLKELDSLINQLIDFRDQAYVESFHNDYINPVIKLIFSDIIRINGIINHLFDSGIKDLFGLLIYSHVTLKKEYIEFFDTARLSCDMDIINGIFEDLVYYNLSKSYTELDSSELGFIVFYLTIISEILLDQRENRDYLICSFKDRHQIIKSSRNIFVMIKFLINENIKDDFWNLIIAIINENKSRQKRDWHLDIQYKKTNGSTSITIKSKLIDYTFEKTIPDEYIMDEIKMKN